MERRLQELRVELRRGQQQLAALDHERAELRDTMLRISGAIQVLEELLAQAAPPAVSSVAGHPASAQGA